MAFALSRPSMQFRLSSHNSRHVSGIRTVGCCSVCETSSVKRAQFRLSSHNSRHVSGIRTVGCCSVCETSSVKRAHATSILPAATGALALICGVVALCEPAAAASVPIADTAVAAAEVDPGIAHAVEVVLRPLLSIGTLLYLVRVPMSWYPEIDGKQLPWVLAVAPTEPILSLTRKVVPLVGGVDVTPLVWIGLLSFFNEILLGPQGLLMLAQRG